MQTNKYIVLFLFFSVTFFACKTKIPQTNVETIKFDDKNDTNNEDKSNENYCLLSNGKSILIGKKRKEGFFKLFKK